MLGSLIGSFNIPNQPGAAAFRRLELRDVTIGAVAQWSVAVTSAESRARDEVLNGAYFMSFHDAVRTFARRLVEIDHLPDGAA